MGILYVLPSLEATFPLKVGPVGAVPWPEGAEEEGPGLPLHQAHGEALCLRF